MQRQLNGEAHGGNRGLHNGGETTTAGGHVCVSADQHITAAGRCQVLARTPLYAADGRVGAVIVGGILTKNIRMSVHALRNPPALALDAGIIAQAEQLGVTRIEITDTESGHVYRTTVSELRVHGWEFDRGFGRQWAMRLTWWVTGDKPQPKATQSNKITEPDAGQLALL